MGTSTVTVTTPSDSVTLNSHAQNVEWNWSATPSHVTVRKSFPPFNLWMYMTPQMQHLNHSQLLSNDFQSWPCSLPSPTSGFPSYGCYPWTGPCSIPPTHNLVVPHSVTPTHNLVGTKIHQKVPIHFLFALLLEIYVCARDAKPVFGYQMDLSLHHHMILL